MTVLAYHFLRGGAAYAWDEAVQLLDDLIEMGKAAR